MIGQINWVITQTHSSVSFDVLDLTFSINKQSTVLDLLKAIELLQKVKSNQNKLICGAFRDLVAFVQFKKREKHPWKSVNFSKVAGFSRFLNCTNATTSRNAPHLPVF